MNLIIIIVENVIKNNCPHSEIVHRIVSNHYDRDYHVYVCKKCNNELKQLSFDHKKIIKTEYY